MPFILYDSNYYNNSYMIFFENDIVAGNGVAKYFNVPIPAPPRPPGARHPASTGARTDPGEHPRGSTRRARESPTPTPLKALKASNALIAEQTTTLDSVDTTYDGGSFEPTGY